VFASQVLHHIRRIPALAKPVTGGRCAILLDFDDAFRMKDWFIIHYSVDLFKEFPAGPSSIWSSAASSQNCVGARFHHIALRIIIIKHKLSVTVFSTVARCRDWSGGSLQILLLAVEGRGASTTELYSSSPATDSTAAAAARMVSLLI